MTIHDILKNLSEEDLSLIKRYYESIQPFEVEPSATYEFDGEFPKEDGEQVGAEITLNENQEIEDLFCTCGAGIPCIHLAVMMYDMEERDTLFISACLHQQEQKTFTVYQ